MINDNESRFSLTRVRLNTGGYDSSGRYWGTGAPLFHYTADFPDTYEHWLNYDAERCGNTPVNPEHCSSCEYCGRSVRRVDNTVSEYVRASDREQAKQLVRAKHAGATFYR